MELISGWKTARDWEAARRSVTTNPTANEWKRVFEEFFRTRLELRYLDPIKTLQHHGTYSGEGFSIAAIQCSLIEFLESTIQGLNYRHIRKGEILGVHEYANSSDIFQNFLTKRTPFKEIFDEDVAADFYVGVRCGLLHEARTKNGWKIRASSPDIRIIDVKQKIVYRNNFQDGLLTHVEQYGADLQVNADYQAAFIRKFNDLCD